MKPSTILKKYKRLEANNNHTEAALLLVQIFGKTEEIETIKAIAARHKANGHIKHADYVLRFETSNKYYHLLTKLI
jgi:hypothetical protein